ALKAYQYIPIAFVLSSRGKEAAIQIETQILDSVTGDLVGASVRQGAGAKLKNDKAQLTLKDVQPLLDKWIEVGASYLAERMK
ncbi:MAG TPA: DUF3313 family protein, partial [Nitrospira sp.]|nr:DUF3313 family protein [Nitrospira sp.]